jgi:hypothetical protein
VSEEHCLVSRISSESHGNSNAGYFHHQPEGKREDCALSGRQYSGGKLDFMFLLGVIELGTKFPQDLEVLFDVSLQRTEPATNAGRFWIVISPDTSN